MSLTLSDAAVGLAGLASESVDALVTDPPAGIGFMGKSWDGDRGGRSQWVSWLTGVMREALRVMKPGAHGLVWALPRTSHWTATALEDAGFEIRDVITHHFGTGFPKSHNLTGNHAGRGTGLKPASEHWILVRKPLEGTVAANVEKWGTGALSIDASRVATRENLNGGAYSGDERKRGNYSASDRSADASLTRLRRGGGEYVQPAGRWPANLALSHADECSGTCVPRCPVREMDVQSGERPSGGRTGHYVKGNGTGFLARESQIGKPVKPCPADTGGASRFFYIAKPSRAERGAGNAHPTVKAIGLMDWLIRLITPTGGLVLDPFTGSGSTGVAALRGGFQFVGFEMDPGYFEIATKRMERA